MKYTEILNNLEAKHGRDKALSIIAETVGRKLSTVMTWVSRDPPENTLALLEIRLRESGELPKKKAG